MTRPLFRLPVRRIRSAALRRAAILAAYPAMFSVGVLVTVGWALAYLATRLVITQTGLARSAAEAWRGEPLR